MLSLTINRSGGYPITLEAVLLIYNQNLPAPHPCPALRSSSIRQGAKGQQSKCDRNHVGLTTRLTSVGPSLPAAELSFKKIDGGYDVNDIGCEQRRRRQRVAGV
jgi:hypothetical protein